MFELRTLKGLILFAKDQQIKSFRYRDFEFNLAPNEPNAQELKALREDLEYTKSLVQKIKSANEMRR